MNTGATTSPSESTPPLVRTRRGTAALFLVLVLFVLGVFVSMLMIAASKGSENVAEVILLWVWIVLFLILITILPSLFWLRYRWHSLRLRLAGVSGQHFVVPLEGPERESLAKILSNPDFSALSGVAVVLTVDRAGMAFWHHSQKLPLGVIRWSTIESIEVVETWRRSYQNPFLKFVVASSEFPLSFPLLSKVPLSVMTMGPTATSRAAAALRQLAGFASHTGLGDEQLAKPGRADLAVAAHGNLLLRGDVLARVKWVVASLVAVWVAQGLPTLFFPALLRGIDVGSATQVAQLWTSPSILFSTVIFACALGTGCVVTRRRTLSLWWTLGISVYATVAFPAAFAVVTGIGTGSLANMGALVLDLTRIGAIPAMIAVPPLLGLLMRLKTATAQPASEEVEGEKDDTDNLPRKSDSP